MKLLTTANHKTQKGTAWGYFTAILHLLPALLSGENLCPWSTPGCEKGCLNKSGMGVFKSSQRARWNRSRFFIEDPRGFEDQLIHEFLLHGKRAHRLGLIPCGRPCGTHDHYHRRVVKAIPFQLYDYTKSVRRMMQFLGGELPPNYHLTFSRSERNEADARRILRMGGNVAVVFRKTLPRTYWNVPVIDGDVSDLRFLDRRGVVVGLRAKGKAKRDDTGFVVDIDEPKQITRR